MGKVGHFKNAAKLLFPDRVLHPWTQDRLRGLCEYDFLSWAGCGGSGKTDDAVFYAFIWWLADPLHSTVVFTSTTKSMIKKRVWPVLQRLYHSNPGLSSVSTLIDSQTILRANGPAKDDKSAIFALAVKEGGTSKAAANIQGMHNKRVLVIIDEAPQTPVAIFEVLSNLRIGCEQFQVLAIGNPESYFDEHGKFSTPRDGWGSVTVDTDEWETVDHFNKPGLCQRFDARKSPNVLRPSKEYSFLVSRDDLESAQKDKGDASPEMWKYYYGFWAPEGVCNTVLSEPMVIKHNGTGKFIFRSKAIPVASLDPAFGGDKCVLRFGLVGDDENGKSVIQLGERLYIKVDAGLKEPIEYQIAAQVMRECEKRGVTPENFGLDATGTGRGIAAVLQKTWSSRIRLVEFGGKASSEGIGINDSRKACEVYGNRVTELWFNVRTVLIDGQIRGLEAEEIREFCSRTYETRKGNFGVAYTVESKVDMKKRMGRSPDDADAVSILVELVRSKGMSKGSEVPESQFSKLKTASNAVYANVSYEPEFAGSDTTW